MSHGLIFCKIKVLMVTHNCGKFHHDSICGSKVINFQMFSWWCSSHEIDPFCGFLGLLSPKYGSNLLKCGPEVFHHKTKTVYEQCFKIKCLRTNGMFPKLTVLVHFWAQFTPGKPKILPKIKILPETNFLELSNDTSSKSQINRRIFIKIIKENTFWAQNWLEWPPGAGPRGRHKFSHSL